jgi:hypothetical protein
VSVHTVVGAFGSPLAAGAYCVLIQRYFIRAVLLLLENLIGICYFSQVKYKTDLSFRFYFYFYFSYVILAFVPSAVHD